MVQDGNGVLSVWEKEASGWVPCGFHVLTAQAAVKYGAKVRSIVKNKFHISY